MKAIQTQTLELPTRRAVHTVVIVLIMVGVGGAMAFGALGGIQDNLGGLTGSNHIAITKLSAYTDGDRLVISGDMKNLGSQAVTSVLIDEISVGNMLIRQSPAVADGVIDAGHGTLTLSGLDDVGGAVSGTDDSDDSGTAGAIASGITGLTISNTTGGFNIVNGATDAGTGGTVTATVVLTGLSNDEDLLEPLAAGSSNLFRIVVTGKSAGGSANVLDVLRTVPAGSEVFVTLIGTDGQSSTVSEPRTATIKQR